MYTSGRFIKVAICAIAILTGWIKMEAQILPQLMVSENKRYIVTENNEPFFWLGDTAWELLHRLTKEDIDLYLKDRAEKGFTVIQTVILAELEGIREPNAYGNLPLIDEDPTQLNEAYFELVDYVVMRAEELGLYVALLPTWGDKFNQRWGVGPEIFTAENAEIYGNELASRYFENSNIIWVLGGDRIPEEANHFDIVNAMAEGIRSEDEQKLITYHPSGSKIASHYFDEEWLDVDMYQSGHSRTSKEYSFPSKAKSESHTRPIVNGEARYENIPDRFWEKKNYGWLDAADARISGYWSILAGAAGYTYGCNDIWQMYEVGRKPTISARTGWRKAMSLPGASQMEYLKNIFEIFPWQNMRMDTSLILGENIEDYGYILASIGAEDDFILAYTPVGRPITVDIEKLNSDYARAYWYNPRSGKAQDLGRFPTQSPQVFDPWASGWGSDFLLVLISEDAMYDLMSINSE